MSAGENPLEVLRTTLDAEGYLDGAAEWDHVREALAAVEQLIQAADATEWRYPYEGRFVRAALAPFGKDAGA